MSRAVGVVKFYVLCNRLKDVVRSEYGYDLDLAKVIMMLATHELEEMVIGDVIPFEASAEEKKARGREVVIGLLSGLDGDVPVRELAEEFYAQETVEAKFAKECDKLEADLQCQLYDEEGCIDLTEQDGNAMLADKEVREIAEGKESASEIWLEYNRWKNDYDENFLEVSKYAEKNRLRES